jgi:hypothetical protein
MPKFIKFQYPNFPQSTVKQQDSALKILKQYGFWDEELNSCLTVSKELVNYYDNVNDTVNVITNKPKKILFKDSEIFDKNKFKDAFPYWQKDKLAYYYDAAIRWSDEKDNKLKDWKAAISGWARKDELEGRLKFEDKSTKQTTAPDYQAFING